MKLQYLYCKEQLEETRRLLKEVDDEMARLTTEARRAFFEEETARFNEIWEEYKSQVVIPDGHADKIYQQLIHETEGIAHDYGLDLTAEWDENSGMIILAFDLLQCENSANPLHLHLGRLIEECSSYSLLAVSRYDQTLVEMTFFFPFTYRPFLDELDEAF